MRWANNRNIKILGSAWLILGGLALVGVLLALGQILFSSEEAEGGVIFVLVLLVLGAISSVNGLALLRRYPIARPLIAITSLVLLIPSIPGVVSGVGIPAFLVLVASLWLTLSRGGKEALESYMARENG